MTALMVKIVNMKNDTNVEKKEACYDDKDNGDRKGYTNNDEDKD